ncbi:MAG: hypothetical protein K8I30_13335 [Anaerolineae bacterium]|nr:hypothetical protein [Anaerolineae bacterium]
MNKLRKTVLLAVLVVVILAAIASPALARKVNEYEGQHITAEGDPSQWGWPHIVGERIARHEEAA